MSSKNKTPAQRAGFEVGDRAEVVEKGTFTAGSIVELYKDDGSDIPLWLLVAGDYLLKRRNGPGAYAYLSSVRKLPGEHATQPRPSATNRLTTSILNDARRGYRPGAEEVRELLANNGESQKQAASRIGVDPRTMRRALSDSDPYRLNAHAWALLIISYLTGGEQ